ncbi:S4 domain-containing protein [Nonomuraea sp. NPDC049028]|uniref:S4 domain-containing protein n=1 Tax=Nonomuraea sp. NPDC049028 TaxID=3364348 RepID=UPI00371A77F6
MASNACRGGHVRVNGVRVRPSHAVRVGDEVRLRHEGHERIVAVSRIITERVGATAARPGRLPAPSPQATETRHG